MEPTDRGIAMVFQSYALYPHRSVTENIAFSLGVASIAKAGRIVVPDQGRVCQVGAPLDLYERPANRFVAGFIGSPAMSFLPGRIEQADDTALRVYPDTVDTTPDIPRHSSIPLGERVSVTLELESAHVFSSQGQAL